MLIQKSPEQKPEKFIACIPLDAAKFFPIFNQNKSWCEDRACHEINILRQVAQIDPAERRAFSFLCLGIDMGNLLVPSCTPMAAILLYHDKISWQRSTGHKTKYKSKEKALHCSSN